MVVQFGLALDDPAYPMPAGAVGGVRQVGPAGFLQLLEMHHGLGGHPNNNDFLRIEQYRQALQHHLNENPSAFFARSFEADQFASAAELLSRRDELLLAGWDFAFAAATPPRLVCLAAVESLFQTEQWELAPGFADRFITVEKFLAPHRHPIEEIQLNEPVELLPIHYRRLFQTMEGQGVRVVPVPDQPAPADTDLGSFQKGLRGQSPTPPLKGDGSLLLLRGNRETDLAAFVAALLRRNEGFRPACIIPHKNRSLDNALLQEGLPGMGILSASLARPTLQVLKLVPVFLWHPIDPFKVMEFVSLAVKPLHDELADRIALQMAQTPGLMGEGWNRTINAFWAELDERAKRDPKIDVREIRTQYHFWFERQRYDIAGTVPKEEVIDIFGFLTRWARQAFEAEGSKNQSLLVLLDQSRRIRELLEALPETRLTHLELERVVRTIYEPAPVQVNEQEQGHVPFVYQPHALTGPVDRLLWWNFVQREPDHFFSRWYQKERDWFAGQQIVLEGPNDQNARLVWQRQRPVLLTQKQLLLVIPGCIDGSEVEQHPLLSDLEARFGNLEEVTMDADTGHAPRVWKQLFDLPQKVEQAPRRLGQPAPFLNLGADYGLEPRDEETISSLRSLFYYPYQWVFRHKLNLRKSSILSIVPNHTLLGNLSHRFFERLLLEDSVTEMSKAEVEQWVEEQAPELLQREGAVLLMYGREPDRVRFIRRIKFAAWSLVHLLQSNGWKVMGTEQPLEGKFCGIPVKGRADLVLEKGDERTIIDLKWKGISYRTEAIRNEEDLQLVLYAKLLTADQRWAHTAYFVMEQGRLLARNNLAFRNITPIAPDADYLEVYQRIYNRMEATFNWRAAQMRRGRVEVRCSQTTADLEEAYGNELLDLLEMKQEDARWDDYRTLIYLVD